MIKTFFPVCLDDASDSFSIQHPRALELAQELHVSSIPDLEKRC